MPIPREIDLTKPKLSWQWLLALLAIVIVLAIVVSLAFWIANKVKTVVAGPKGSQRRAEERRI
uniref:Uncharacterized protein n=1 Tax=viral metagenome TaxID=1070528 RepID=A0A6M3Y0E3_9ZZZZ